MSSTLSNPQASFAYVYLTAISKCKDEKLTDPFRFSGHTYRCRYEWLPDYNSSTQGRYVWATISLD